MFLVTKIIGKKQVSEFTLFDYVIGISIGNFAAEMTINLESDELHGIFAVLVFGFIAYLVSFLTLKSIKLRRFFMGTPTTLIQDGIILNNNLRKVRYDVNDLLEQCRIKGYFNVSDISYAVLESNGELSILPKSDNTLICRKDLNLDSKKVGMCSNVIIDGKIMKRNLYEINKDEKWLIKNIDLQNKKLDNILLGIVDIDNNLTIFEKNDVKILDILE